MQILHIYLEAKGDDDAEFRYFWDNPYVYESRDLSLKEISNLIKQSETDYYTRLPVDYAQTGQTLYSWLDGDDRILQIEIDKHRWEGIILAISTSEELAHLPWEVLHDGQDFLVNSQPVIIPVRWVTDNSKKITFSEDKAQNRPLNVVFMSASPQNIEPKLDYEAEEKLILEENERTPLYLEVEESRCLTELGYRIRDRGNDFFDVLHLTGHATFHDENPCFITETESRDAEYSTAVEIAKVLQFQYPKLIFLSGCRTGYSHNSIPSLAENLLTKGKTAILGWGNRVLDTNARQAAAQLYRGLSSGQTVTQALAKTYQELIKIKARDWHLLRLYVARRLPGALVTPSGTDGRKPLPSHNRKTTSSVGNFHPQLKNCLQTLRTNTNKIGVLIIEKHIENTSDNQVSQSFAVKLCQSFPEYKLINFLRKIDEFSLVKKLGEKLPKSKQRDATIHEINKELKDRLCDLFNNLNVSGDKPFIFTFYDFQYNLEKRQNKYVMTPGAAKALKALVWAIKEANSRERVIITCNDDFNATFLADFDKQSLEAEPFISPTTENNDSTVDGNLQQAREVIPDSVEPLNAIVKQAEAIGYAVENIASVPEREYRPTKPTAKPAYFLDSTVFQLMPCDIGTIWGLQRSSFIGILISFEEAKIYENFKNVEFFLSETIEENKEKNLSGTELPKREWIWLNISQNHNPPLEKSQIIEAVVNPTKEVEHILGNNSSLDSSIPGFFLEVQGKELNTNYAEQIQNWCQVLLNELFPSQSVAIVINIVSSIEANIDKSVKNLKKILEKIAEEKPIELMLLDYQPFFKKKLSETTENINSIKLKNQPGLAFCSWMYNNFMTSSFTQEILERQNNKYKNVMELYEKLKDNYSEEELKNVAKEITPNNIVLDIKESASQDLQKIYEQLLKIIVISFCESSRLWISYFAKSKNLEAVIAAFKIATDDDFIFLSDILMDAWIDAININTLDLDLLYQNGAFTSDSNKSNKQKLESLFLALLRKESNNEKVKTIVQELAKSLLLQKLYDFYQNPTEKENDFLDSNNATQFAFAIRANIKFEQVINQLKVAPASYIPSPICWLLTTITPTKDNIIELLQLEPIKRAVLGLCTDQEWQKIQKKSNRKSLVNDCRRDRPLIF